MMEHAMKAVRRALLQLRKSGRSAFGGCWRSAMRKNRSSASDHLRERHLPDELPGHQPMTAAGTHRNAICEATCACGNGPTHEGFYQCDPTGRRVRKSTIYCCERCGLMMNCITGKNVGHRSFITSDLPLGW